ncbi:MAG: ABC transporter permease [Steroidobacteraceae bacterium]
MYLETRQETAGIRLRAGRSWTVDRLGLLERALTQVSLPAGGTAVIDLTAVEALDLSGAWVLRSLEHRLLSRGVEVQWAPARPELLGFVDEALGREAEGEEDETTRRLMAIPLERLGIFTVGLGADVRQHLAALGELTLALGRALSSLRRLRLPSLIRQVHETGVTAIPIVALIAFLISVIVAYIGAQQLRQFGGEIFVVDLVTIAVLRELGVLLTAIIVAGRSGSAFAAELGVMKLNEEVDALRAIGMDPVEVLVAPRVLGLVVALPLLTVLADFMGLAGGALLSWALVDITFTQYADRVAESLSTTTFWIGLIKAPVFAFAIAMIGTLRGMQVRGSSRELGRLTTVAVVESIFVVIFLDAAFAVLFMELDI